MDEDDVDDDSGLTKAEALNQYAQRENFLRKRGTAANPGARLESAAIVSTLSDDALARPPDKSGWVEKASASWLVGWQRRWLKLSDGQLKWYASSDETVSKGSIDFDFVTCEAERLWTISTDGAMRSKPGLGCFSGRRGCCTLKDLIMQGQWVRFRLCPEGSNRAFELRVESVEEGNAWVEALIAHLRFAERRSGHLRRMPSSSLNTFGRSGGAWWKVHRISPEQFERVAETGDVLLFRSKGTFPKLIRAASGTWARYDHVAMVVKVGQGEIALLEATGGVGVGLTAWKEFLANDWHELYPELALRRVHFKRTRAILLQLQNWACDVIGKPYSLSVGKLSQGASVSEGGEDTSGEFFCSQLVAEGLKVLGVIPRGLSSTQYWPSTFSALKRPPLTLEWNCSFGDADLTIDFALAAPNNRSPKFQGTVKKRDATTNWG